VDAAYALDSTVQELIWIAGPLLLAVLLAVGGRQLPLVACGVLSIAGTVVYTLGLRAAPDVPGTRATATSPLRQARVRVLLACCACYGVSAGILNLALVAFAGAHGGVAWAGVLVAIWGTGSLAGGLAYGSRNWKSPAERRRDQRHRHPGRRHASRLRVRRGGEPGCRPVRRLAGYVIRGSTAADVLLTGRSSARSPQDRRPNGTR